MWLPGEGLGGCILRAWVPVDSDVQLGLGALPITYHDPSEFNFGHMTGSKEEGNESWGDLPKICTFPISPHPPTALG